MDLDKFTYQMIELLNVITILPFTIVFYMYKCFIVTSWVGPIASLLTFTLGAICHSLILPKVVVWAKQIEEKEGDYRWSHAKIRSNGEAICMYEAETTEKCLVASLADQLFQTQRSHALREFFLNWSVQFFDLIGGLVPYMCLGPLVFGGKYEDKTPDELAGIISLNSFQIIMLIYQFTQILDQVDKLSDIIACGERISDLLEFCKYSHKKEKRVYKQTRSDSNRDDCTDLALDTVSILELSNVDVEFKSRTLLENISLSLQKNENLMITGPNGSGKSSLFRTLKGIWRINSGAIIRLPTDSMFISQNPYVTEGSLLFQISFPNQPTKIDSRRHALHALKVVGLDSLQFQLDEEKNWGRCLSLGEQQKVALARVFYRKPDLVFLDESTSGIPEDEETKIYQELKNQGISYVSIVHRSNLAKFHKKHLKICSDGQFHFSTTTDASQ
ncbi:unnamed protein product [Oikopleura dioica]|uniref:ABC transporter domain-containing protein n=1 Tax=Oikopleura dioica TaxID=34765 RepID=E4XIS8_OIKDI|nr:unnamed protein product [Oikopleura dioica]